MEGWAADGHRRDTEMGRELLEGAVECSWAASMSPQGNLVFVFVFKMFQLSMGPQSCSTRNTSGIPGSER